MPQTFATIPESAIPPALRTGNGLPRLWYAGDLQLISLPLISIVGKRDSTSEGESWARQITAFLVNRGFCIVSGLAKGIDAVAHSTALSMNGKTIAVLGTPIDECYPKDHFELKRAIEEKGLILSQFPPGTKIQRGNFPQRNEMMAALSLLTIVIEADVDSGTRHQVKAALADGRKVGFLAPVVASQFGWVEDSLRSPNAFVIGSLQDLSGRIGPIAAEAGLRVAEFGLSPEEAALTFLHSEQAEAGSWRNTSSVNKNELFLNGFRLSFSADQFTCFVQEMPDNTQFRQLRDQLQDEWFLLWRAAIAYGLPKVPSPKKSFGSPRVLSTNSPDALRVLAARLNSVLPEKFPQYETFRRRPFTFRGKKDEIVAAITASLHGLPSLVNKFKIFPKFELDARLVELQEGTTFVGLFMEVSTSWDIQAPIDELQAAGVDVTGLYVLLRNPPPAGRRLVGRIGAISGQRVTLKEYFGESDEVFMDDVVVEGSKASFGACLKQLLQGRYLAFERERQRQEAKCLTGTAVDMLLMRMSDYLTRGSSLQLAPDLECRIHELIRVRNSGTYETVLQADPVDYCFDAARTKRTRYAWQGIERYGPFSRETFAKKSPRILIVLPDSVQGPVENFLRCFRDGVRPQTGASAYGSGFAKTFGLVNPQFVLCRIPWLGRRLSGPAIAYRNAIEDHLAADPRFDAAIVAVMDEHARLPDIENPYLVSKAVLLMAGVPVQDVKVGTISQDPATLQWALQNIAVALYSKLNGTPWTVAQDLTIADELVIGMGTCELLESRFLEKQRFVGITTVFRGDGNYLLGNLSSECNYREYPEVLKASTVQILEEIKVRNGWRPGDTVRIVFHSYKPLKRVEVAEIIRDCVHKVGADQNVEFAFLTVSQDHTFFLLDKEQHGIAPKYGKGGAKAVFVPPRGLIVQLGRYTRLLCTNGPELIKRELSPLPAPLLIHIHPDSTFRDLTYLTDQVLKFTSLSWRSTLPAKLPVTIYYSELISELLARLRNVRDWSPAMLNVKLRASKWFL
jgi:DNA protecting protein DprA